MVELLMRKMLSNRLPFQKIPAQHLGKWFKMLTLIDVCTWCFIIEFIIVLKKLICTFLIYKEIHHWKMWKIRIKKQKTHIDLNKHWQSDCTISSFFINKTLYKKCENIIENKLFCLLALNSEVFNYTIWRILWKTIVSYC